jgi:glyoxylase I family protein
MPYVARMSVRPLIGRIEVPLHASSRLPHERPIRGHLALRGRADLGMSVLGRDTVSGAWTDTAVGLDGNHAKIAMLQTPDGNGRLELFEYVHPDAIETEPTKPNEIGMHRVAFSVDNLDQALEIAAGHGCHPLRGVATYEDVYKLTYVRGPSGILVMLAEELNRS